MRNRHNLLELFLAVLQVDRIDDRLALAIRQRELHSRWVGRIDHALRDRGQHVSRRCLSAACTTFNMKWTSPAGSLDLILVLASPFSEKRKRRSRRAAS